MKYIYISVLSAILAVPAFAQTTSETAVHSAIEACVGWIENDQVQNLSSNWVEIFVDTYQGDTSDSVTRIHVSSQYPLAITTSGMESKTSPDIFRFCNVEPVDTSRGHYRYRLRKIEVGDTWNNLTTLSAETAEQQLLDVQATLAEDSDYIEDIGDARPSSHGRNRTFWRCTNDYSLNYGILPDGVIEASNGSWSASLQYASVPLEQSESSRANCPSS